MIVIFFRYVGEFFNVKKRSPTSQTCRQQKRSLFQHSSLTLMYPNHFVVSYKTQNYLKFAQLQASWLNFLNNAIS